MKKKLIALAALAAIEVAKSALANNQSLINLQQISIEQAEAAIKGTQANAEFQRSEQIRYKKLLRSSSISQTTYDDKRTKAITADVELKKFPSHTDGQ